MTTAAATRRGWVNHVPSQRVRQDLDPEARAYFMAADDLRKDRSYFLDRPGKIAAICGLGKGPAAMRRLQRLEARLEKEGKLRRVLIRGRIDKVSGRETFTGRIGVIPLVTLTELPIVTLDQVPDLDAWMRSEANRRQRTLPLDPIVARQICRATLSSCTTDLTPLHSPTGNSERDTETTTYAPEPESSSSFLDCVEGNPEEPQVLEPTPAELGFPPALGVDFLQRVQALKAEPPSAAPALDQTLLQVWIVALIALGLRRSKDDPTPVLGALAESLISRAAGFYRGGLRWVAWAIHGAAQRKGPDRGPVKFWTYLVRTLMNWEKGDGEPPDGWPEDPTAAAELPRARSAPPAPAPMSVAELTARIAELVDLVTNGPRAARALAQIGLDQAREELAALEISGRTSS